jgi:hypothetical protein
MRGTIKRPLKILTWHIHGSYLYYLSKTPCEFYLPVKDGRPEGYGGRSGSFPWGENVLDVPAEKVKELEIDCILFRSGKNYQYPKNVADTAEYVLCQHEGSVYL